MVYQTEVVNLQQLPPAETVLSEREQAFYQTLKLPKRRTEWLGGRLALKRLLVAHAGYPYAQLDVLAQDGQGKPIITAKGKKVDIPFSITHSHGFAMAAIAPEQKYIGIDLEKIAPRIKAWKTDFFHPSELAADTDEFLTQLWTHKEALVKLLGSGLTINSFDVRVVGENPQFLGRAEEIYISLGSPKITLQSLSFLPGFCCSVAVAN